MSETDWNDVLTGSYEPVTLSRDKAARPKTVKRVLRECYGTEAADVIAALVYEICLGRERERYFTDLLKKVDQSAPAAIASPPASCPA